MVSIPVAFVIYMITPWFFITPPAVINPPTR